MDVHTIANCWKSGLLFAALLAVFLASCAPVQPPEVTRIPSPVVPAETVVGTGVTSQMPQGRVVFLITDAAANMSAVSFILITIDAVHVHSATEGWITVSSEPKVYDLLKLKAEGSPELLADVTLAPGTYQQLRLDISNVVVVDNGGEHTATLPSSELKIIGNLEVNANETSTASFDFMADDSLHVTGKGEYILAPVIQVETQSNADVEINASKNVKIRRGNLKTRVTVGMKADGNIGVGVGIPRNARVSIVGGRISVETGTEVEIPGISKREKETNASAKAGVRVGAYS